MLDRVTIKSPCTQSWDEMVGTDDAVRFCCTCSKNVYDLSAMDREAAEAFLQLHLSSAEQDQEDSRQSTCVKLFRRPDGRILTSECGPGNRRRHAHRAARVLTAGLAATTLLGLGLEHVTRPTLSDDPPEWSLEQPAYEQPMMMSQRMSLGAVVEEIGEVDEDARPIVRIDEGALALEEEPESELLGTSAKTERASSERRGSQESPVLPGAVHLVTPPATRF